MPKPPLLRSCITGAFASAQAGQTKACASWLEHLKLAHEACGFKYVRFHGLFHDDMFVYQGGPGKPRYNWQYVDDLFDRILAIGVRPFVELAFMPQPMAFGTRTTFWWKANTSPPKDNAQWADMVGQFLKHCIARYGKDEVRNWYFEVWNEPDLQGFWDGTKTQYFEFYMATAKAVKAVDPSLRVGGPATSNFVADQRFDGEREDHSKWTELKDPEKSEESTGAPSGSSNSSTTAIRTRSRSISCPRIPIPPISHLTPAENRTGLRARSMPPPTTCGCCERSLTPDRFPRPRSI